MNLFFATLRLCGKSQWFSLLSLILFAATIAAQVPAPKDVLGFTPVDDRKLASWASIVDYFKKLDTASDRMIFEEIGKTTMGAPFVYATISSPENLKNLATHRDINNKLADPRKMGTPTSSLRATRLAALIKQGKTITLLISGIPSPVVGATLSWMRIAHRLASCDEPEIKKLLDNAIILLVPSLNPDGVDIAKSWYNKA